MRGLSSVRNRLTAFCRKRPILSCILGIFLLFVLSIARYLFWPPVGYLATSPPETTAFIEYRKAQWAERGKTLPVRQVWVPWSQLSPALRQAVIIAEDDSFWTHEGFDLDGMQEALEKNIQRGRIIAGGSTITQQLAKNLWFSPEKAFIRKAKEAIMAWRLERNLEKRRILEIYLNVVEWGDGVFGAEAAARRHFNKSASALTQREAAILAVMLPAPLRRKPSSPGVQRQATIIQNRMSRHWGEE